MQIKIGIVGLGAIGSVISKSLHSNEYVELFYYTRSPKTEIKIKHGSSIISIPIKCESLITPEKKLDWVIICLKAHQFQSAQQLLKSLIGDETKVVVIRNGINLVEDVTPFTRREMILPCIIDCPVQKEGEEYFHQLNHPLITTVKNDLSTDFKQLFPEEHLTVTWSNDFKTDLWKKLIESASIGAIQCFTGQTCIIFRKEKILNQYRDLVRESITVAKAAGAKIGFDFEEHLVSKVLSYPPYKGSSMLTDKLSGNEIELDAKNGAISKTGIVHGIPTPLNDFICKFLAKE